MTIIICAVIILWLTICAMIYKLRELDKLIKRYNQRITNNFAQSYQNKQHIDSVNRYIDDKAKSVLDKRYVDDNGDVIDKDGCPVEASFVKDITEEYNMRFNQLAERIKALEDNKASLKYINDYLDVGSRLLNTEKGIKALEEDK